MEILAGGQTAAALQDGAHDSSVVPGKLVDSSTTSVPGRNRAASDFRRRRTAPQIRGSIGVSPVGTQITTVSAASMASSVVAVNPVAIISARSAPVTPCTGDRPAFKLVTTGSARSKPWVVSPFRQARRASGRPT